MEHEFRLTRNKHAGIIYENHGFNNTIKHFNLAVWQEYLYFNHGNASQN